MHASPLVREFGGGIFENLPLGTTLSVAKEHAAKSRGVPVSEIEDDRETDKQVQDRLNKFLEDLVEQVRRDMLLDADLGAQTQSISQSETHHNIHNSSHNHHKNNRPNVLLVSHGKFISHFLTSLCNHRLDGKLRNCSISRVKLQSGPTGQISVVVDDPSQVNHVVPQLQELVSRPQQEEL